MLQKCMHTIICFLCTHVFCTSAIWISFSQVDMCKWGIHYLEPIILLLRPCSGSMFVSNITAKHVMSPVITNWSQCQSPFTLHCLLPQWHPSVVTYSDWVPVDHIPSQRLSSLQITFCKTRPYPRQLSLKHENMFLHSHCFGKRYYLTWKYEEPQLLVQHSIIEVP